MPVVIVAGDEDRLVDINAQSTRLHLDVPQSRFHRVPGTGHMIHQTATGVVMSAINEVAEDMGKTNNSLGENGAGAPPSLPPSANHAPVPSHLDL
jgi:hypothetical protein